MNQSFLLTNMCPQDRDLNMGDWEGLERRCRGWAKHYGEIYIVAGPIFYNGVTKSMGANKVGVPDAFFKVVLCLEKEPKAIGFIFPNNAIHHELEQYVKTVDEVEEITGFDFFHNLPDETESKVESYSNLKIW
jgi:endonuclease G